MKIDELLLTEEEINKQVENYTSESRSLWRSGKRRIVKIDEAMNLASVYERIAQAQIEKIKNNLPSNEEIQLKIVNCLYGGMGVDELKEWLKENLLIKEVENG